MHNFEQLSGLDKKTEDFFGLAGERILSEEQKKKLPALLEFAEEFGNKIKIEKPGIQLKDFQSETEAEELLQEFIGNPMLSDSFDQDNSSRREWEKECLFLQDQSLIDIYQKNKLAKSRSQNIVANFLLLYEGEKDVSEDLSESISAIIDNLEDYKNSEEYSNASFEEKWKTIDPYDQLTTGGKMEFMERYEQAALKILSLIKQERFQSKE
jgi:hypothetical protein